MLISEAASAYTTQLRADGRSVHTVKQAARFLRKLATVLRDPDVAAVRHEDLAAFFASDAVAQRADGGARRANSANALRSVVRCYFSFCHSAGYAPTNAARLVRRARCAPPRPRGPSEADAEKLLAALETARTDAELRDRALFVTMLRSGIRVGSAVALDVDDLDLDTGTLRLRTMKNGDTDTVFLAPDVVALLRDHVGAHGPLFAGVSGERLGTRQVARRLSLWCERAGIRHISPHSLRHAFGQRLYDQTGDLLLVSRAMTHRSLSSTSVYARPSDAMIRAAVGASTRSG